MTLPRFPQNRSGFTLIEVVISAALMAIILVGAYLCLSSSVASQKLIESRAEVVQSARVALAIMSADLRSACPLSKELPFLGLHRTLGEAEADNLDFATHHYTPRRARESDFCEVSYFVAKEPESGKLSLWRRRDPTPDDEPLAGGSREEIARGLQGLRFEYYDGFDWFDKWGDADGRKKEKDPLRVEPNMSGMPEAVRITLWINPNSRASKKESAGEDTEESALMFQTVCRLNLASISQSETSSATPTSGSGGNRNQSRDAAPSGATE